ncbi:MAG: nitronate monooxygenase family protein [Gemmatimonadaceae bacterium]
MRDLSNHLRELLEIDIPIVQAPMAGVQDRALALAASSAGALGSLPCAMLTVDALRAEVAAMRAETDKPINLNFFCHTQPALDAEREAVWRRVLTPYYREFGIDPESIAAGAGRAPFSAEIADMLDDVRPKVVSFHFGLPAPEFVARIHALGATILASATTLDEAVWLEAHGADVIIAQGLEAGGHRGIFLTDDVSTQLGTFALVPQVVRAVKIPVIAAGGITDAGGVRAAIALGAAAVQVGTAYLLSPEATTSQVHRAALKGAAVNHTALTNLFTGRPARGIVNRLMRELGALSDLAPPFPFAGSAVAPLRAKSESMGSGDFSPLWSGQNASGCNEIGAAELTRRLASEL